MSKQTFTTGQVLTAAQMTSLQQTAMGGGSTTAKTASYVLVAADAGTVVQMNAAGATTITVNTALFAAGDSVQIQNVGAGVCTVTAGTATVSTAGSLALSQYEGGQLYFNTTSAALFFDVVQSSGMTNPMTTTGDIIYSSSGSTPARLGIGTTGQVLNVASGLPAWATPVVATPTFIGCVAYNNSTQNLTSGVATALNLTTEEVDTDGYHSTVTNTSRMTVPAGKGGVYLLNGVIYVNSSSSFMVVYFYKNGVAITNGVHEGQVYISGVTDVRRSFSIVVTGAVATDYYEIMATGDGSPVNQKVRFAFTYLGA